MAQSNVPAPKAPSKLPTKPYVADPLYGVKLGKSKSLQYTPSQPKVKNSGQVKP